jgi:hypothetical protein
MKQGQMIRFQVDNVCKGTGKICGIALNGAPVIGKAYIIEIISSNIDKTIYPYTHTIVFENMIFLNPTKGDWKEEISSGYRGYRCSKCGMWCYENQVLICDCDK